MTIQYLMGKIFGSSPPPPSRGQGGGSGDDAIIRDSLRNLSSQKSPHLRTVAQIIQREDRRTQMLFIRILKLLAQAKQ